MIIKLLLILSLFYGFTIHSQTNKESNLGFESLEERGELLFESWKSYNTKGETNPKQLKKTMENCLLSVDVNTHNSIKLVFIDRETSQKARLKEGSVLGGLTKGSLCIGVILDTKIVKIGDEFLFDSDGVHVSTSLKLLEINKEQVVFEYTKSSLFGFQAYSSTKKGILYWELD
jgi:hypothetical protein